MGLAAGDLARGKGRWVRGKGRGGRGRGRGGGGGCEAPVLLQIMDSPGALLSHLATHLGHVVLHAANLPPPTPFPLIPLCCSVLSAHPSLLIPLTLLCSVGNALINPPVLHCLHHHLVLHCSHQSAPFCIVQQEVWWRLLQSRPPSLSGGPSNRLGSQICYLMFNNELGCHV